MLMKRSGEKFKSACRCLLFALLFCAVFFLALFFIYQISALNPSTNNAYAAAQNAAAPDPKAFDPEENTAGGFAYGSGDGKTAETAFLIATPEHLDNVRRPEYLSDPELVSNWDYDGANGYGFYFKLVADIDLGDLIRSKWPDLGWLPIGNFSDYSDIFYGYFDGNGKTVSGLWLNRPDEDYAGLFGCADTAVFCNLKVVLAQEGITGKSFAGGIAGDLLDYTNIRRAKIANCSVTGSLALAPAKHVYDPSEEDGQSDYPCIGGLAGRIKNGGMISGSYFEGKLADSGSGKDRIGGLAGQINSGKAENSYAKTEITLNGAGAKTTGAGGLFGIAYEGAVMENCYAETRCADKAAAFKGRGNTGADVASDGTISTCYYNKTLNTSGLDILNGTNYTGGTKGLTSGEMKLSGSYAGFDFETVWDINEGKNTPELQYFLDGLYPKPSSPLSPWAIAGIALGGAAALFIAVFAVYWFGVKRRTFASLGAAIQRPFIKTVVEEKTVTVEKPVFIDTHAPAVPFPDTLTEREHEVAVLLLKGKARKEIQSGLYITEATVKKHIAHIYEKTGCTSRAEFSAKFHGNN